MLKGNIAIEGALTVGARVPEDFSADITLAGGGSMTLASTSILWATKIEDQKLCHFSLAASFTTGGTAHSNIEVSGMPTCEGSRVYVFSCSVENGGSNVVGQSWLNGTTGKLYVTLFDRANWSLGAARKFYVTGTYELD